MQRNQRWFWILGVLVTIVVAIAGNLFAPAILAQSPTRISPSPRPSPSALSPPSPLSPTPSPSLPTSPPLLPPPPASTAPPLPLSGDYKDPTGRFKVGILQGFKATPLAGSVLIESPDGNLAYSVVAQSQPTGFAIDPVFGYNNESLAKIAAAVFQRGEGFQPGTPVSEAGGGVSINWTGTLTIGGAAQPVGGVILVRPSPKNILLLLIAATQKGSDQLPGAVSALSSTLQAL